MIHPFDDSDFYETVLAFRAYLACCRDSLNVPAPVGAAPRKLSALDKELAKHRSTHVYLLLAGKSRTWPPSATRQHAAPVWTTINAA